MELDERKAAILRAIVEEHVATAQPVGSQTVARSPGLNVSSATVRNDMTVLEYDGYIVQPHTSAGRIPTDLGYRYFVDHFSRQSALSARHRRAVADFFTLFTSANQVLDELLQETSQLLARVSSHTAVVVGPHPHSETASVRSVQLVSLQPTLVLVLAILSNGNVEKCVLHLTGPVDDATIAAAGVAVDSQLSGARWSHLPETTVTATGNRAADALAGQARDALAARGGHEVVDPLYVGGASRLAAEHEAFPTATTAARLLELLEHQVELVSLVQELLAQEPIVSIGSENSLDDLRDCSIVVAPYRVDGEVAGTVGVLGPTRMDYRQALAAVEAISEQLGRVLS
ncbi:MAG TPA: heat-inducible transcriptional repressor HrcA [Acidimicrobiia bacterium]|nr:heat-inducible transcriptional repressor HrcA [Acidimicrobiia bacterium]